MQIEQDIHFVASETKLIMTVIHTGTKEVCVFVKNKCPSWVIWKAQGQGRQVIRIMTSSEKCLIQEKCIQDTIIEPCALVNEKSRAI